MRNKLKVSTMDSKLKLAGLAVAILVLKRHKTCGYVGMLVVV